MSKPVFKLHNSNYKAVSNQSIASLKKKIINNIKQYKNSQQIIMKQKAQQVFYTQKQIIDNLIKQQNKDILRENIVDNGSLAVLETQHVSNDSVENKNPSLEYDKHLMNKIQSVGKLIGKGKITIIH
jgi:valyl-tRNA synthetase